MIPPNVTLIVKAPNQQIEDQNVECQSSWTVRQLKGHLSEVYPSKPRTEEQKIIYSGQLLDDNTILKDVLRTYESQIAHTMHLVCTPSKRMPDPKPVEQSTNTDGLRQRHVNSETETERPVETASRPETRQNDQNHTVEMQNYLSSIVNNYGTVPPYPNMGEGYLPVPNDPALLANHMMMIQQAYVQYMQQYANMWQANGNTAPVTVPPVPDAPPAPPAAEPPPPPPADEEEGHRDWLDHLYAASRLAIMFSLVYLYGSPARLLLVLLLAAAGYLHQIGFFRDLQVNPQANAVQQNNAPQQNNIPQQNNVPQQNNAPQHNNVPQQNNDPATPENAGAAPPPAPADNADANQQSLLAVTWMIVTTFFASLIPDTN